MAVGAELQVDLAAIRSNIGWLRRRTDADILVTVKADGYGHGMAQVGRAAVESGASWLGVAFLHEALRLREAGIYCPILVYIITLQEDLGMAVLAGIDVSVGAPWGISLASRAAKDTGRPLRVHLECDSGMSRGGACKGEDWVGLLAAAREAASRGELEIVGIWSHLACADEPEHPANAQQLAGYAEALEVARHVGVVPQIRHLANSPALIGLPGSHYDLVRPGLAAYGKSPFSYSIEGLVPAMTLRAPVVDVYRDNSGRREAGSAILPIGLDGGIFGAAGGLLEVSVRGRRCRVGAPVSMDRISVQLSGTWVEPGESVVLFGDGRHGTSTVHEWAIALNTDPREVLTRLSPEIPRRYLNVRFPAATEVSMAP